MRKLTELFRGLSKFLADPAGHVVEAWSLVKGAIDPKSLAPSEATAPLRNAVVVLDNVVESVVYYLQKEAEPSKQTAINDGDSQ